MPYAKMGKSKKKDGKKPMPPWMQEGEGQMAGAMPKGKKKKGKK
ncbi:MAG: hypothetical protein ACREKR_11135 [Candidatus Methylomirabilales bacterium]